MFNLLINVRILTFLSRINFMLSCIPHDKMYVSEILNEPMKNNNEEVDEGDLRQLIDMGFPESRARKALLLNKYI